MKLIFQLFMIQSYLYLISCLFVGKRILKTRQIKNSLNRKPPNDIKIIHTNEKKPFNDLKTESIQFTLPQITIDSKHNIDYYYPYFYKTHIIDYYDNLNTNHLSSDCLDLGCEWCDTASKAICHQCRHGFYNYNSKCYTVCPYNYIADIYKRKCSQKDTSKIIRNLVYLKAFTNGSCRNKCNSSLSDCSCQPSCISSGNCCSDYHLCEYFTKQQENIKDCSSKIQNCELCELTKDGLKCGKCKDEFFLKNGECLSSCPVKDKVLYTNKLCINNKDCLVENCSECTDNNQAVCKRCNNGFYLHDNLCNISCPLRMRADRISWSCVETPVFAWYWIFPSKASCSMRCGMIPHEEMECSCSNDCYRFGNCCQDYEDFCAFYIFWK